MGEDLYCQVSLERLCMTHPDDDDWNMIRAIYQQLWMILTSKTQVCPHEEGHTNITDLLSKYKVNLDYRPNLYWVCVCTRVKLLGTMKTLLRIYYGPIKSLIRSY